jgi:hypothetical protein
MQILSFIRRYSEFVLLIVLIGLCGAMVKNFSDVRTTRNALNSRGNLYRSTLNFQMDELHFTPEQRDVVNKLAKDAGLPETTTVPTGQK